MKVNVRAWSLVVEPLTIAVPLLLAALIVMVGTVVSTTKSLLEDKEFALLDCGNVFKSASFPATSFMVPPFKVSAITSRSLLLFPSTTT